MYVCRWIAPLESWQISCYRGLGDLKNPEFEAVISHQNCDLINHRQFDIFRLPELASLIYEMVTTSQTLKHARTKKRTGHFQTVFLQQNSQHSVSIESKIAETEIATHLSILYITIEVETSAIYAAPIYSVPHKMPACTKH